MKYRPNPGENNEFQGIAHASFPRRKWNIFRSPPSCGVTSRVPRKHLGKPEGSRGTGRYTERRMMVVKNPSDI
jgi:hypothetical protein